MLNKNKMPPFQLLKAYADVLPDVDEFQGRIDDVIAQLTDMARPSKAGVVKVKKIDISKVARVDDDRKMYDAEGRQIVKEDDTFENPYLSAKGERRPKKIVSAVASLKGSSTPAQPMAIPADAPVELRLAQIPSVEWWDAPFMAPNVPPPLTDVITHPRVVRPDHVFGAVGPLPEMLTKKERAKLRHMRRVEASRVKHDRISAGLDPTPAPKVKLRTMARQLGAEMALAPTEVQRLVEEERRRREAGHEAAMLAQTLTTEERWDRACRRRRLDEEAGREMAVFTVIIKKAETGEKFKPILHFKQRLNDNVCPLWTDDKDPDAEPQQSPPRLGGRILHVGDRDGAHGLVIILEGGRKTLRAVIQTTMVKGEWGRWGGGGRLVWRGPVLGAGFGRNFVTLGAASVEEAADGLGRAGHGAVGRVVREAVWPNAPGFTG